MVDEVSQDVQSIARDAMAQLRLRVKDADRDEARRIYAELKGLAEQIRRKHDFVKGGTHRQVKAMGLG